MSLTRPIIGYGQYLKHIIKYGRFAPHPRRVIHVDPANIKYQLHPKIKEKNGISKYKKHVLNGDWDKATPVNDDWYFPSEQKKESQIKLRLDRYILYKSIRRHFEDDIPWENTRWYQYVINNPGTVGGEYDSRESMENQLSKVDNMYQAIRQDGYKSQRELGDIGFLPEYDEVTVHIGREGELYKAPGGRHRLILAKLLDIKRIPVNVHVRHELWQKKRIQARENHKNLSAKTQENHPDLEINK